MSKPPWYVNVISIAFMVLVSVSIFGVSVYCLLYHKNPKISKPPEAIVNIGQAYSEKLIEVSDLNVIHGRDQKSANQWVELRARKIEQVRSAFFDVAPAPTISETPWKDGVRQTEERPILFEMICLGLDHFKAMQWALQSMEENAYYNISWEETGIHEDVTRFIFRNIGLQTARRMILMFEFPRSFRKHVEPCSRGESSWNFSNEFDGIDNIVHILDQIGVSEDDLGVTYANLRNIMIKEVDLHVAELEDAIKDGYVDRDETMDCLSHIVDQAEKEWNIPMHLFQMLPEYSKEVKERRQRPTSICYEDVSLTLMR